jgi:hypothetical protein
MSDGDIDEEQLDARIVRSYFWDCEMERARRHVHTVESCQKASQSV